MIELTATNSSAIAAEFVRSRRRSGSPAMGMIMTLVIVADKADAEEALSAARSASREHPARILVVVFGDKRGAGQVDAQVGIGSGASGERAVLRLSGEVTRHAESVVLPLLLPDSPVVVWWPGRAPKDPAADPWAGSAPGGSRTPRPCRPRRRRPCWPSAAATRRATPTWPGPGSPDGAHCLLRRSTRTPAR